MVARAIPAALAAVLVLGSSASGETGFSPVQTLRTGPSGAGLEVADVAGSGRAVSVVWEELLAGESRIRLRTSTDGGATFRSSRLVEDDNGSAASTDICGGLAWVAHSYRLDADPEESDGLILDHFALSGGVVGGQLLVESGGAQFVEETDMACVGSRRRAVAWVDRDWESSSRVRVRFLPFPLSGDDSAPPDFNASFPAGAFTSVAIAATANRAWLAWETSGGNIRVKRFAIGPGPDFAVTPGPAVTLPDAGTPTGNLVLAASGSKVLLAYGVNAHTFARVSTDGGTTFGPRRRLREGIFGGDLSTSAFSADIRGSRAVVHAAELGGFEDTDITAYRFRSSNDGVSWSGVRRYSDGYRLGAFTVISGETRLLEAWDQAGSTAAQQRIRSHRQL